MHLLACDTGYLRLLGRRNEVAGRGFVRQVGMGREGLWEEGWWSQSSHQHWTRGHPSTEFEELQCRQRATS
ncbi:hypothetical protein BaRGS_00010258 [Batillaria attramentaria]|uniref:Uncharacterized protein n=1 Tax=Batillaria attramentaria TaxID=370345 RepID=A0ABD0LH89_9CAEN